MTAARGARTVGASSLVGALRRSAILEAFRRVRRSDYLVIGASRRFRAEQRRRTVTAARVGFLLIGATTLLDAVLVLDRQPEQIAAIVALNGVVIGVSSVGWWLLGREGRRWPDPIAAIVTLALLVSTAGTGLIVPSLAVESAGYLILFPVVVTLILPWSTRVHVRWLGLAAIVVIGFLVAAPPSALDADARADLVIVNLMSIAAALAGHVLLQAAAIRNHHQVRKITQLRRRADANTKELARVHSRLEETARTDPLTGARNRLRLAEDLQAARGRMGRLGEALGIIAFDLDRFKLVNDLRGHRAGDDVLKAVVASVQRVIRIDDVIYRFGGEEFLVLARVVDEDGLRAAAERIRAAVGNLAIAHPENMPHGVVTISVGAAIIRDADAGADVDDWFGLADAALYRAKANGRNRVELAA